MAPIETRAIQRPSRRAGVRYADGGKPYDSYRIFEGTSVRARLDVGGEVDLHMLGSIVEMDGRYKLLSYRDRD